MAATARLATLQFVYTARTTQDRSSAAADASANDASAGTTNVKSRELTIALVMELVEAPTLAERIEQGPIPPDKALNIAPLIADGLEAADSRPCPRRAVDQDDRVGVFPGWNGALLHRLGRCRTGGSLGSLQAQRTPNPTPQRRFAECGARARMEELLERMAKRSHDYFRRLQEEGRSWLHHSGIGTPQECPW